MRAFGRFAWSFLAYNLAVIGWGAFVRATGSGAGCGRHWPTCQGAVIPRAPALETVIEFTHRATSGIAMILAVILVVWARRVYAPGHAARRAAWAALAFMVTEALLGAGLVLFGWVAANASLARGWAMAAHLANTFLLLASIALTAAWSDAPAGGLRLRRDSRPAPWLAAGAVATLLAGVTGAVAALGDTLFPATTFAEGLRQELSSQAHLLLRLRVLHPFAALGAAAVLLTAARAATRARPVRPVQRAALALGALVVIEVAAGVVNLALLAPIWLQVVHLLLADLVWVTLVLLAAAALAPAGELPGETRTG